MTEKWGDSDLLCVMRGDDEKTLTEFQWVYRNQALCHWRPRSVDGDEAVEYLKEIVKKHPDLKPSNMVKRTITDDFYWEHKRPVKRKK